LIGLKRKTLQKRQVKLLISSKKCGANWIITRKANIKSDLKLLKLSMTKKKRSLRTPKRKNNKLNQSQMNLKIKKMVKTKINLKKNLQKMMSINRRTTITKVPAKVRRKRVNLKKECSKKINQARYQRQQPKRNHYQKEKAKEEKRNDLIQ